MRKFGLYLNEDRSFFLYLIFAIAFLGAQMFQGLSYLDIGMYMSGYQYFNKEPYTIYYLGQWILSYQFTGWLCDLFSIKTFFGLRIVHLVYVIILQVCIYLYLKIYICPKHIIAGLFLATLAHLGAYTEINYNDYTVGLLTAAIIACHRGIMSNNKSWLVCCGIIIGISFFFRMTNLAFLSLPLWVVILSYKWETNVKLTKLVSCFYFGVFIGCLIIVLLLWSTGTLDVLLMTLYDIVHIGTDASDPHSLKNIFFCFYELHKEEIKGVSVILLIFYVLAHAVKKYKGLPKYICIIISLVLVVFDIYFWEHVSSITVGLCLAVFFLLFLSDRVNKSYVWLYGLSLYIPLVMPLGSNAGAEFFGKDVCFLSLPMALSVLFCMLKQHYLKSALVCYSALCVAMVYVNIKRPMMEEGNRLQCLYSIDNKVVKPILTTKESADSYNYLLKVLPPLIPRDSYLVCDFSLPIISMLDCKPFAVFSTVFTSNNMNRKYIAVAYEKTGKLPFLLSLKGKVNEKDDYVEYCLSKYADYKVVWEDDKYVLKRPYNIYAYSYGND